MTKTTSDPATIGPSAGASTVVWGTTSFVPGNDVGLVARHTIGLVERNNPSTRERLWRLVSVDAPLDDILDELSSTGLKSLPDFGVAQVEGDSIRVVARGRTVVTAELASGATHVVDATTVKTWIEEVLPDFVSVTISIAPADGDVPIVVGEGDTFAVLAGSVPAASMTRRYDEPDPHAGAAAGWPGGMMAARTAPDADEAEASASAVSAAVAIESETDDAPSDEVTDGPDVIETPEALAPSDASWLDESEAAPPLPRSTVPVFDHAALPDPQGPAPTAQVPQSSVLDSTIIAAPDDAEAHQPVVAPFDAEADLAHSLGDDLPDDLPGPGDLTSRVIGVLAFSNGVRIDVDRPVLIGRNPKLVGAVDGMLPHILKYEGPGQGLSRTHAEIRIENGELVLEDLKSTNGTEVELPGEARRRLHGGDPIVIVAGTLIDFGDELHCIVESAW